MINNVFRNGIIKPQEPSDDSVDNNVMINNTTGNQTEHTPSDDVIRSSHSERKMSSSNAEKNSGIIQRQKSSQQAL